MDVPFYPNHEDNMHCQMAVYASVVNYFFHKKMSWEQLEKLTGYKPGKAAWTVEALPKLVEMGLDVKMIEPFDYSRYLKDGEKYLRTLYDDEELAWHNEHSNIREMKEFIPLFQKTIHHERRVASLKDIDDMLDEGRLVFVTVNSRALNDLPGYVSHALLVIKKENGGYVVHDSGLPPKPFRVVEPDLLLKAMGGKANTAEATGFKPSKLKQSVS